ncbi:hypothetical protein GGR54DRAFT_647591 [Hypoxylon sp. NC1633]|nr:hypothetical protein GGR54DRAFT_647591 [Hypoxylon sp. NC1633]
MRPRIFNRRFMTEYYGPYARRFGTQPAVAKKISLTLGTKTPRRTVIEELNRHLAGSAGKQIDAWQANKPDYGAAIFASRDLAKWLEDEGFMSGVLESLFQLNTRKHTNAPEINVLYAVTDGLAPGRLFDKPQTGLSILYGSANSILPGLWDSDDFGSNANQDRESSVSFLSNPLRRDTRPLEIRLPLANTMFQNGRRSTLLARRWQPSQNGSMARTTIHEKQTQIIRPPLSLRSHTLPYLPLLPLTPPRKIVAGLGNIVRQVEVNGSPTPASKELEGLIPKVFDSRSVREESYTPGPIGVWCWVIPPHAVEKQNLLDLKVFQAESSQSEAELSLESMNVFSELLSSGSRLHRILSGGGGWGAKQGLLSLDPETKYSLPDQDDVEMFIKAFQERDSPNPSEGLVTPGSYLMFCIEPHLTEREIGHSQTMTPSTALGVAPNTDEELDSASPLTKVEVIDDHFGVVSKAGLFLETTTPSRKADSSNGSISVELPPAFTTKVDSPRSSFLL